MTCTVSQVNLPLHPRSLVHFLGRLPSMLWYLTIGSQSYSSDHHQELPTQACALQNSTLLLNRLHILMRTVNQQNQSLLFWTRLPWQIENSQKRVEYLRFIISHMMTIRDFHSIPLEMKLTDFSRLSNQSHITKNLMAIIGTNVWMAFCINMKWNEKRL